jgi:hypothetical protein
MNPCWAQHVPFFQRFEGGRQNKFERRTLVPSDITLIYGKYIFTIVAGYILEKIKKGIVVHHLTRTEIRNSNLAEFYTKSLG